MNSNKNMPSSEEALQMLLAGNERYIAGEYVHPHQDAARKAEMSGGQAPYAIILGCSDSRVPPEVIFDQGLGDLFIIRVAGNIIDDVVLGSIEYAAEHLGTPLMMVLGHSKCGAVTAVASGAELEGHLPSLAKAIQPAVDRAKVDGGDLVPTAINFNAQMTAEQLVNSKPVLAHLVEKGQLKVVSALYDIDSGQVTVI